MIVDLVEVLVFLNSNLIVSKSLFILAKELVALACVHVILGKVNLFLLVGNVGRPTFCPDRSREVIQSALVLCEVHIAKTAIHEGLGQV